MIRRWIEAPSFDEFGKQNGDAIKSILSFEGFCRRCDIIDLSMHHVYCLRYRPSMIASAAIVLHVPSAVDFVAEVQGCSSDSLNQCLAFLKIFREFPSRPLMEHSSGVHSALKVTLCTRRWLCQLFATDSLVGDVHTANSPQPDAGVLRASQPTSCESV
jgi:hypothetical protein